MPPERRIHAFSITNEPANKTVAKALDLLRPFLPTSLPLYRRLQFGRFFEATTLLSNLENLSLDLSEGENEAGEERRIGQEAWVVAFVDRSCRPETEVWTFGSWEVEGSGGKLERNGTCTLPHDRSSDTRTQIREAKKDVLIKSLVRAIRDLGPIPESIHQAILSSTQFANGHGHDEEPDSSGVTRKNYTTHLLNPSLILFGATHHATTHILSRNGLIRDVFDAGLVPNWTYIFNLADARLEEVAKRDLPEGLKWGELDGRHWGLVKSRTQIPRQERTLAELPNLAIIEEEGEDGGRPVAWVFVGLDGSLTTLHVEEEWRGKGLARLLAVKLWKEKMPERFFEGEEGARRRLAHDYVISGNVASARVSEGLGGEYIGDTFWVRVDLEGA